MSWGICVVGSFIIGSVTCCLIIGATTGLGYWAHQIDNIHGHTIRCEKEFDGTVEMIVNNTVRVVVERESYLIDSLPEFNITTGSNVIVYSSCEYLDCESKDNVQYKKEFWWNPPKADTNCSDSIENIIIVSIGFVVILITGSISSIFFLCCIVGYFQKHYKKIDDELSIEKRCEKAKERVEQNVSKLKQYPQSLQNYEEV